MAKHLRIGLLGPPHASKFDIIDCFLLQKPEEWGHFDYIESPGNVLQEEYDIAMGSFGSYREDILAVTAYMMDEREAELQGNNYITSGTLLSPLCHSVTNLEITNQGLQTTLQQGEVMARQYSLAVITMMVLEYARYNFIFRVPHPLEQPEGMDDFEWYYRTRVERSITPTLEQLNLDRQFQLLPYGTPEEQAMEMVETIKRLWDNIPEDAEGEEVADEPSAGPADA